jgi:hypothetical protein
MKIYKAKVWFGNIEVTGHEVIKETEKQYKTKNNIINKNMIGVTDSCGYGYGLTPGEAVDTVKRHITVQIEQYKARISNLENDLIMPIKEINC